MIPGASEQRFRAMIESSPQVVALLDRDGRVTHIGGALERQLGRPVGDCQGKSLVDCLGSRDADGFARLLGACLSGQAPEGSESAQLLGQHGSGDRRTFEVRLVNRLADPALGAVVCFAEDVTERGRGRSAPTPDRITAVGLLVEGVVHEINNPLAAAVTSLEMASNRVAGAAGRGGSPGPFQTAELAEDLRSAREATERVRQLVRDLGAFSAREADRLRALDVEVLLDGCVRLAGHEIRHRARLERDYRQVPQVLANAPSLGQILFNFLLGMARSLSPDRTCDNLIRLSTRHDGAGRVLVEIAGSGPDLPDPPDLRLFTGFAGSGPEAGPAGLRVGRGLLQHLGGQLDVETLPGRLIVQLRLPAAPKVVAEPKAPDEARRRGRVLVVDDEPTINSAIARTLAPAHEVVTTTRAAEALAWLRAGERYDVIFCDLMMPQMTGMDLHQVLQVELPEQAGRMIFLTGGAFTVAARRFLEQSTSPRLEKPFDTRVLRAIVDNRVK